MSRTGIAVILACLLIPRGVELNCGTIMLDVPRVLLTVIALAQICRIVTGARPAQCTAGDLLIGIHVGVIGLSALYHMGLREGLEDALAYAVDMGCAYVAGRTLIQDLRSYQYFVRTALAVAAVSAVFGVLEACTGYSAIRGAWHVLFPNVGDVHISSSRLGFYRALAAFRVDILFGLYCATTVLLATPLKHYDVGLHKQFFRVLLVIAGLGVVASLSSGPWLAVTAGLAALLYDHVCRRVRRRWLLAFCVVATLLVLVSVVSRRSIAALIVDSLTLNVESGYVRLAMWESVISLMPDHWLIGWGWGADWPRPEWYIWNSIDSYYGVLAVQSGIIAVAAILGALMWNWLRMRGVMDRGDAVGRAARGWVVATVCLFGAALTVHIFHNLVMATYLLLGAGHVLHAGRWSAGRVRTGCR